MPQLVGSLCAICGRRISDIRDGDFCATCQNPVHHACLETAQDDASRCPFCGSHSTEPTKRDRNSHTPRAGNVFAHFFSFHGRVSRGTYFFHSVFEVFALVALFAGIAIVAEAIGPPADAFTGPAIFAAVFLWMWSEIAITVKRLHDIGQPGGHWFLLMVPIYNIDLELVLLFRPGDEGDNEYGADPKKQTHLTPSENLLTAASRHEMNGDWLQAFELYKQAAEGLNGQPDGEYAVNCIKRLQEKLSLAQQPDAEE